MLTHSYPETILIVDDNPNNLDVLSEALALANLDVAVATSGEAALKQLKYVPPSLILLDVMMPGISGFETCERLKADPSTQDIPVIFMTALADPIDKVRGFTLGAVDYITKPFQQEEVLARVRTHLKLRQLNQTLEQQVADRTAALSQSLQDLQKAHVQLINSEKMSMLGNLMAGVAHEINNPVGCLNGNINPARNYIEDLLHLLDLYRTHFPDPGPEITEEIADIDLDYVREDLPKLIDSMALGIKRIKEISASLRTFARADTDEKTNFDLHEGLDSALLILRHRLKANERHPAIEVTSDYGQLPLLYCFPGQLNQVFINLLANAVDAIDEANHNKTFAEVQENPRGIRICTACHGDQIVITITDQGSGMTPEVQSRIFDHLFTTKAVGLGTGLGLSIAHQIVVERHGGTITCESQLGQGTTFTITLPI
ncbi:MAG: hybrid sensor histidine kinase/response regulator [Spirulina sp. DLM2.Bin59]|nr:MAG: hybrid sensor histidine kinase/response regulator [Spirulina sp. DLM2.Bin59]